MDDFSLMSNPSMRLIAVLPTMVDSRSVKHKAYLPVIKQIALEHRPPLAIFDPIPRRSQIGNYDLSAPFYNAAARELWDYVKLASLAS
jgi:hypothetical protein